MMALLPHKAFLLYGFIKVLAPEESGSALLLLYSLLVECSINVLL
jgi:hypothetical protein